MTREDAEKRIQELLAEAQQIIDVAADLAMQHSSLDLAVTFFPKAFGAGLEQMTLRVGDKAPIEEFEVECSSCNGSGKETLYGRLPETPCWSCNGAGKDLRSLKMGFRRAVGGPRWFPVDEWDSSRLMYSNDYNEWLFGDEYRLWNRC